MNTPATPETDAYIPGVCNINTAEIANRRKIGYTGTAIFVVLLIAMLSLGLNRFIRIALVLPAILAASGFLQARNHFCVGYAGAGQQNASEGSATASDIADIEAKAIDKQRARKMNLQTIGIGLVITAIVLLLPNF
jgi:hypothetical protein